jgi:hypothetical protein
MPAYSNSHQGEQAEHAGHAYARWANKSGLGHTGSQHSAVPRCWSRRPTPTLIPILNLTGNAKSQ